MKVKVTPILSKLMKERQVTQSALSSLTGVPQGSISRFDKNERHVDWHVFAIAKALDVSIEDLFLLEIDYD